MKKAWISKLLTMVLVGSIVLTGCQGSEKATENKPETKGEGKEITLMVPEWGVPAEDMLKQFTAETGIKVNVDTVAWDAIRDKIAVAANGKKAAADVVEVDWSWVGEFNSANWLEPIEMSPEDIKDIASSSSFSVDGKLLAVPYANDFRIAYYNTEYYNKAGLKAPNSFNDVAKDMKTLKDKGILKYPYTLPLNAEEGTTTALIWLTFLRDGVVFNDDNSLNKENVMKSLTFINDAVQSGLINPGNITSKAVDTYRQISLGEAAFMVGPSSFASKVESDQSKVVGKVKAIVPPGSDSKAKQTMALAEALGVLSYSEKKEEAKKFVSWYTSAKMQKEFYEKLNITPTRTSVLKELIDAGALKNADGFLETSSLIKSPFPNGVPKYYAEMSDVISNSVNKMASGTITPEAAFEEMDAKINELRKK